MGQLRDQAGKANSSFSQAGHYAGKQFDEAVDKGSDLAAKGTEFATETFQNLSDKASLLVKDTTEKLSEQSERLMKQGRAAMDTLGKTVSEKPVMSALVAGCAGLIVGLGLNAVLRRKA